MTTVVLAVVLALSVMNTLGINATSIYQFSTKQALTVSAAYSFGGPNPNAMTLFPGTLTNSFTLTINNFAGQTTTAYIYFQAGNPTSWTFPGFSSQQSGCGGTQQGTYSMGLNGVNLAPLNETAPPQGNCSTGNWPSSVYSLPLSIGPGVTTISGNIAVAGTASAGDAFSLSWFASTAPPA